MAGVNKVILVGNLGKDPEIRNLESGAKVANFSLATTDNYKDKDGNRQSKTEWHNIVLWRGLAEIAEKYLKSGQSVYIEGKLQTRSWDDQNGVKRYTTEILGQNMTMLGGKNDSQSQNNSTQQNHDSQPTSDSNIGEAMEPDDLPF